LFNNKTQEKNVFFMSAMSKNNILTTSDDCSGDLLDAVESVKKTQSTLEGLHSKLLSVIQTTTEHRQQNQLLSSQVSELTEVTKKLESKSLKLIREAIFLRSEKKRDDLRSQNTKLRKALDKKTNDYELSIKEHVRTKLENDEVKQSNIKLNKEIFYLNKKLGKENICSKAERSSSSVRFSNDSRDRLESRKRSPSYHSRRNRVHSLSHIKNVKTLTRSTSPRGRRRSRSRSWRKRSRSMSRSRSKPLFTLRHRFVPVRRRRRRSPMRGGPNRRTSFTRRRGR